MRNFARLVWIESKLFAREPVGLIFVFAFPIITVLVIAGSFEPDDPAFGGATPASYYVAAYIGVALAGIGFVMLPVHLASYRERGVLRRFRASHFAPWALPAAWSLIAFVLAIVAIATMLATGWLVYGLTAPDHLAATILATVLATAAMVSIGIMLGLALPSARAAQSVGLILFFPSFLLGGAGPPQDVMPAAMRTISDLLPLTHVIRSIHQPWLSIGASNIGNLAVVAVLLVASAAIWLRLALRSPEQTHRRRRPAGGPPAVPLGNAGDTAPSVRAA